MVQNWSLLSTEQTEIGGKPFTFFAFWCVKEKWEGLRNSLSFSLYYVTLNNSPACVSSTVTAFFWWFSDVLPVVWISSLCSQKLH